MLDVQRTTARHRIAVPLDLGVSESLYYTWSKEFLEAGKQRLAGDTARQATSPEVKELRSETTALKEVVADLTLENRLLKKSMIGGEPLSAIGPRTMASECEA